MKYRIHILLGVLTAMLATSGSFAQHWQKVLTLGTMGSAASFANANVGCIGTGNYGSGTLAGIWYTTDGGTTWTRSLLPNMNIIGQVTDISYTDDYNGWAAIRESIEHGWSGLYRTFDGGRSWQLWLQAVFPVAIRQTSKGIFFTDRYVGLRRSVDDGNTFPTLVQLAGALGLDFMNDNVGIVSTEGDPTEPYYTTVDGGLNWLPYQAKRESWGTFADPTTKRLFYASEHDIPYPGSQSYVGVSRDFGVTFQQSLVTDSTDGLTGGIAGIRGCRSVIYVQRQHPAAGNTKLDDGMMRSTDGGVTWTNVGGPYNYNDKRFAVTGRGAVVYAFDRFGGIWKTSDGGDGQISASIMTAFKVQVLGPGGPLRASLCDSATMSFKFNYANCDSVSIINVGFPDDTLGELSSMHKPVFFGYGGSSVDSVSIRYKPLLPGLSVRHILLSIRQADGFVQDTTITVTVQGLAAPEKLTIPELTADSLGFGTRGVCADDSVRVFTITNVGCSTFELDSITVSGAAFSLQSAFTPVPLDPGFSKQYLLRYNPVVAGPETGLLVITTPTLHDTIILRGTGRSGDRGIVYSQVQVSSTVCDSATGTIRLRNVSCNALRLDSLSVGQPFRIDPFALPLTVPTDSTIILRFHFVPKTPGTYSVPITIHSYNLNVRFDTTVAITGVASEGTASVTYSPDHLDFGQVSICSARELTVTIVSTGCDTLDVPTDALIGDTAAFHIVSDVNSRHVLSGDTIRLIVHFHPPATILYGSNLHIVTNAGAIDIPITGTGTSDPGTLTLGTATLGTVLTCKDTTFSVKLENTTCDSMTFDSVVVTGPAQTDFIAASNGPVPLAIGGSLLVGGVFSPQAGGSRDATIHCYLHRSDGTPIEITSALHGTGIQPSPVGVMLAAGALGAGSPGGVSIPITVLDTSYVDVRTVELVVKLNTDLLSPTAFDLSGSIFGGATVRSFTSGGDSASILLDVPPGERLRDGLLGTMSCSTFVTDTINTSVTITRFDAFDDAHSNGCLPTSVPQQSTTSFTLLPSCGTNSLVRYLAQGAQAIFIEGITPNPAQTKITIRAQIHVALTDDLDIDMIDEAGAVVQHERIPREEVAKVLERTITLKGASGTRILRLRSGSFEARSRFLLVR